ncbi:MAG: glycosyltransferase family 4 protein [Capsulimonadaceae bacterium]
MFLDYTTALAERAWPPWTPFRNQADRKKWYDCETSAYQNAKYLFPMSEVVRRSLRDDYHVDDSNISVVGSAGDYRIPFDGAREPGGHRLLFSGTAWERKGGDLVLAAFADIHRRVPDATLTIVGRKLGSDPPGVTSLGYVRDRDQMRRLFMQADVLMAPARCDPFPTFALEALNYGVPLVVSPRDGMPELVDYGGCGVVLPELTAQCLAHEGANLLCDEDRKRRLSEAARAKVKSQWNWDVVADNICRIIREG